MLMVLRTENSFLFYKEEENTSDVLLEIKFNPKFLKKEEQEEIVNIMRNSTKIGEYNG